MLAPVLSIEELERMIEVAQGLSGPGEELGGVIPTEPSRGTRIYLFAFGAGGDRRTWLAFDAAGEVVETRAVVRDAVSIAALCEVAEETAGGGDLDDLRSRLVALRLTEDPPGVDEAEEALTALQQTIGTPPRIASPAYLEAVGAAARRLEAALGGSEGPSPFTEAMKQAVHAVEALTAEVEGNYKRELGP